jgi:hypothetical protein
MIHTDTNLIITRKYIMSIKTRIIILGTVATIASLHTGDYGLTIATIALTITGVRA